MAARTNGTPALALVVLLSVVAVVQAGSCTVYIDRNGNDATGTGASGAPFATLWRALNATDAAVWPKGSVATVCYNGGTYPLAVTSLDSHWTQSCAVGGGVGGYDMLEIRSAVSWDTTQFASIHPNGLIMETCKPLRMGNITLIGELWVDISVDAPEGTATTFEWMTFTGNASLTWSADHDAAALAAMGKAPVVKAKAERAPGVVTDSYPFWLRDSLFVACTVTGHGDLPIWAYNHGSGSMHIHNVTFTGYASDVEGVGPSYVGQFQSVDQDATTNNQLFFTNVTVAGNRFRGGLDITGGDVMMHGIVFVNNVVPDQRQYALAIDAHTVQLRDSTFRLNSDSGAVDIEIVQAYQGDYQFATIERCVFAQNSVWLHADVSGFVFPPAVAIDSSAANTTLTIRDNAWDCNKVQNGSAVLYIPPLGVRTQTYIPVVSGNTVNSACPVQCVGGQSGGGGGATPLFSPCGGLFDCTTCGTGAVPATCVPTSTDVCAPCAAGTYFNGSLACTPCPAGFMASGTGSTQCTACTNVSSHAYAPSPGAAVCGTCAAGSTVNPAGTSCDVCPAESFVSPGTNVCAKCPASFWRTARKSGSSDCSALTGGGIAVIIVLSFVGGIILVGVLYVCCKRVCLGSGEETVDVRAAAKQIQAKPLLGDTTDPTARP